MATKQINNIPCPSCVFRGPVWLDKNHRCVYCKTIYESSLNNFNWIWQVVPWQWWLEEGMIKESEIPPIVLLEIQP